MLRGHKQPLCPDRLARVDHVTFRVLPEVGLRKGFRGMSVAPLTTLSPAQGALTGAAGPCDDADLLGRLTVRTAEASRNMVSSNWLPLSIFVDSTKNVTFGSACGGPASSVRPPHCASPGGSGNA